MRLGLRWRIGLVTGALIAVGAGAIIIVLAVVIHDNMDRMRSQVVSSKLSELTSAISLTYAENGDWQGVQNIVQTAAQRWHWHVVLSDMSGTTIANASTISKDVVAYPSSTGQIVLRDPAGHVIGGLQVFTGPPPSVWEDLLLPSMPAWLPPVIIIPLVLGAAGLVFAYMLSHQMLGRLDALTTITKRIGNGELSTRAQLDGEREIVNLGEAINILAEKLEHIDTQRRTGLAEITHELRRPLANLQGYATLVQDQVLNFANNIQGSGSAMYRQVESLSRQIDGLQLLAASDSDTLVLNREAESVSYLLRFATEGYEQRALESGIVISVDVPASMPPVYVDRFRIHQVVGNLVDNAIAHMPDGGEIRVSAEHRGSNVFVTVQDTGEGIQPEILPRIFDRFYSGQTGRGRATTGIGLGLTVAKNIIELHDGTIKVESVPGDGTTFTLSLPVASKTKEPKETEEFDAEYRASDSHDSLSPTLIPAAEHAGGATFQTASEPQR